MLERKDLVLLGLIIFLAGGLRFLTLGFDSFWLDESYQSMVDADGYGSPRLLEADNKGFLFQFSKPASLSEVIKNFRQVDPLCPPLYALTLNRWICCFGNGDFALRALSVLFSLTSLVTIWLLTRKLFGSSAAHLAALVQAVSPFDIHYAQEARMYALMTALSTISMGTLILLLTQALRKPILMALSGFYVLSTWALINTHYTGLFLVIGQVVITLFYLLKERRLNLFASFVLFWLMILVLWLPWLPLFIQAAALRNVSFYVTRQPSLLWPFYALFCRIPVNWLSFLAGQRVFIYAWPIYLTSAIMLIVAALVCLLKAAKQTQRKPLLIIWLWAIIPACALWGVDCLEGHKVISVARYTIFTAPAIYILAGFGLSRLNIPVGIESRAPLALSTVTLQPVLAFTHIIFAMINYCYLHTVPQKEPWRQMARIVERNSKANDTILVSQYYDIICLDRYLHEPRHQIGVSSTMGEKQLKQQLDGLAKFILITAQEGEAIKNILPKEYYIKKEINLLHGLHFRIYCKE